MKSFNADFLETYKKWLMAIVGNSMNVILYFSMNCIFIHLFQRLVDKDIAFGDNIYGAPYYYIDAEPKPGAWDLASTPALPSIGERVAKRLKAPGFADQYEDETSSDFLDRIMPRFFRIDNHTALAPYASIAKPTRCMAKTETECKKNRSKDKFGDYYLAIITHIMWGYRNGFRKFSMWSTIFMNTHTTKNSILYQITIKFLLLLAWLVWLIGLFVSFMISMGMGAYAAITQHTPNYKEQYPTNWTYSIVILAWSGLLYCTTGLVALCAIMTGVMLWCGPILFSQFCWLGFPLLQWAIWHYSRSNLARSYNVVEVGTKEFKSIFYHIATIFKDNIEFLSFIFACIIYYSSTYTMNAEFTSGVGMVMGCIIVFLLYRMVSFFFKPS